jgi:ribonucleoside-diphosphate reductase alpha chain
MGNESNAKAKKGGKNKIVVSRVFTKSGEDALSTATWVKRDSVIYNTDGSVNYKQEGIEAPESWDQVSIDILASKYLRKKGVTDSDGGETSVKQWAVRLANAWKVWGIKGEYFKDDISAENFFQELVYILIHQIGSPNSPQHFNTGLYESYGIVKPSEGNCYFDEETNKIKYSEHRYERSAANACFILSVKDELVGDGGIFDYIEREARLFKAGSGSGANLSDLRAKGENLSGGGSASGVMSFMRVADRAAGAVKSGGTTRRAAKMVILDVDHPEIERFIWCKVEEELKVKALVEAGYPIDWNGEAYDTVAYQNGNNSVRILPGFMDAVANDLEWELKGRRDFSVNRTVKARKLWEEIAEAAWRCADPGVQFDDILNDWNTASADGRLRGSNPCSEYTHINDTACNLASINLVKFLKKDGTFDIDSYKHVCRLFTILLEITVSMSHYPSEIVARNSFEHRTLGLGYANLGALLMRMGKPYDSVSGRSLIGALTSIMNSTAYSTSSELAEAVGKARAFDRNKESMERVIKNHARASLNDQSLGDYENLTVKPIGVDHETLERDGNLYFSRAVKESAIHMLESMEKGYRNMQVTVLAPTGTIGLQMGCDTTGVEPDFALVKFKKLAGGGYMKIVNNSVEEGLRVLGYSESSINNILKFALGSGTLKGDTEINYQSLIKVGLSKETVDRFEEILPSVTDLSMAIRADLLTDSEQRHFGKYLETGLPFLRVLGFNDDSIKHSNLVICGRQTVEGAPDLRDEDLAVFDTANYCGIGTRVIEWEGHVKALAVVAPHLSGSASKTINLPNSATVADIQNAYKMCYELGVKAAAVYRDGSKLSQVLYGGKNDKKEIEAEDGAKSQSIQIGQSPSSFYHGTTPPKFRLPDMRFGPTWKINVGGTEVFLRANQYEDGSLGEIFIDLSKEGSTLKGVLSCFAISISQGLQHGVPLSKFVETFTFHNFAPQGTVIGHANLKMANSIIDAIFRILAYHYLDRADLVQNPEEKKSFDFSNIQLSNSAKTKEIKSYQASRINLRDTGETCVMCGGVMVKSGTCSRCLNCGETSGCS